MMDAGAKTSRYTYLEAKEHLLEGCKYFILFILFICVYLGLIHIQENIRFLSQRKGKQYVFVSLSEVLK